MSPGQFVFAHLAPGRYAVAAVPPDTSLYPADHDQLVALRESATVVTVEAGQIATMHLKLTK